MPHRKLKLMMCLFVFSGLISGISSGQAPSRSPSASTVQNDLAIILKDLSEIDAPGAPGGMCVFGPQAFTVIAGTTGKKGDAELPLVSAARFGLGRIAGLGHTGYFGTESLNKFDTGKLIVNLIRWASDKTNPRIGIIREDKLAKYLKNQGLTVIPLPGKDMAGELKNCDILCCNSDRFGDEEARTALLQFIQKGGGVVGTMTGWGWQQINSRKSLVNDSNGNKLFAEAGIVWSGSMPGRTSDKGYSAKDVPSKYCNALVALDALQTQAAKKINLSKEETIQCVATLSDAVRAIADNNSIFWSRFKLIETSISAAAIPTEKKPITNSDGLAKVILAYQIHKYQSMPSEQVKAHPAATNFPGAVPKDAPRVSERITIKTENPRWHSTGLYAAPGELITVTVPQSASDNKLRLRIGCHSDGLWNNDKWSRPPEITRVFPITNILTKGACAFGGLIYIDVPQKCTLGEIAVQISGAVRAPWYILGKTDPQQWRRTIRNYPAPIAEFQTDKLVISIPSRFMRELDDPEPVMKFWNEVMDACADLAGIDRNRPSPERFVSDVQISVGYMHSGYPLMCFLDAAPRFIKVDHLRNDGDWGMFHEIGHNHQNGDWTFNGAGEVTVNLFSLYILDTVATNAPKHGAIVPESRTKNMKKYFAEGAQFSKWQSDPFLALIMYVQLREAFGWDSFKKVIAQYRTLGNNEHPKNDEEKRDQWMVRFSKVVGKNLGPFFQAWNVPTSDDARKSISDLPAWMPEGFPPK
ncbi:MAG: hypothetical protein A2283_16080 [Lentisphaerae bacterium RIFOXYA12_FULL_48_11]|nr:MAG: hypothetical protein A2283_16080 [Lentisphaerae bacterium RIFOXYA12_FULL_48_11]